MNQKDIEEKAKSTIEQFLRDAAQVVLFVVGAVVLLLIWLAKEIIGFLGAAGLLVSGPVYRAIDALALVVLGPGILAVYILTLPFRLLGLHFDQTLLWIFSSMCSIPIFAYVWWRIRRRARTNATILQAVLIFVVVGFVALVEGEGSLLSKLFRALLEPKSVVTVSDDHVGTSTRPASTTPDERSQSAARKRQADAARKAADAAVDSTVKTVFKPYLLPNKSAGDLLHEGWRFPSKEDQTVTVNWPRHGDDMNGWFEFRKEFPDPFHVRADFDGDGLVDDAWLLLHSGSQRWSLFVFLHDGQNVYELDAAANEEDDIPAQRLLIRVLEPAQFTRSDHSPAVRSGLLAGLFESDLAWVYYWDSTDRTFKEGFVIETGD